MRFSDVPRVAAVLASIVLLNASLTFGNVWPTPGIRWENALSIELAVFVLVMAAGFRWTGSLSRWLLPAIWVLLVIGHYADVTAPGLYGRDFNIYWDSPHLADVAAMLIQDVPWWLTALTAAGTGLALAAMYLLARLTLGSITGALENRSARRALVVLAATVTVLFAGQYFSISLLPRAAFADSVAASYLRQARYILAMFGPGAVGPQPGPSPVLDSQLEALRGADVVLIFAESYGAVAYEVPEISDGLNASRDGLEAAVHDAGREVVSAYVESPTFGGSSWLAHLSLLSGVEVRDPYSNAALMSQRRDTLVTTFARNGYRTVGMMPGIRQEWPEGAFYKFDTIYNHDRMDYKGPHFGWWEIPDQYALARLDALELGPLPRRAIFAVFPTGTTHAPFGPVAPYQPDWSKMLTSEAFDKVETQEALADRPDLSHLRPSYVKAMSYALTSLAGYVREHHRDNLVMIVLGDHQPPAAVSGRNAPWDVPVHVIASSGAIVDRLLSKGFQPGLTPRRPSIGKMNELVPVLLYAFGDATDSGS